MSAEKTDIIAEQKKTDEKYMKEAIRQAKKAYKLDETPIGCVIVHDGKIIGRGYNRRNTVKVLLPMRRSQRSGRPAESWATGDWKSVRFMLRWNLARCVPERLCSPG